MAGEGEFHKLQRHLNLLREEYVKLQIKFFELEKKYKISLAASGNVDDNSFVCRLLKFVADLYDKDTYSDMTVLLDSCQIRVHRFVLAARSDSWGVSSLAEIDVLDFSGISFKVGSALLKWVYTDQVDFCDGNAFTLDLMKAASQYQLTALMDRCEKALITSVDAKNCIKFYQTADEIGADGLKNHCSELISTHWEDFTSEDFEHMSAPLLYKMFKAKTEWPLHAAIRMQREDVVFLFLIEFNSLLPDKLNELDNHDDLPLDLALQQNQLSIAETLLSNNADVGAKDSKGRTLLHKAILRGDVVAATFLISKKAPVNEVTPVDKEAPLHLVAKIKVDKDSLEMGKNSIVIADLLLQNGANPNLQNSSGWSPLHLAIESKNKGVFSRLLEDCTLDLELRNSEGETPFCLTIKSFQDPVKVELAVQLFERGCNLDAVDPESGDSLMHLAAKAKDADAGLFLTSKGANPNLVNKKGESPLHIACSEGLALLVEGLLKAGANPNLQTFAISDIPPSEDLEQLNVYKQTPLNLAIINQHEDVIQIILDHKAYSQRTNDNRIIVPNFNLRNSEDQSPLSLALASGLLHVAQQLLSKGANVNEINKDGLTLLHEAILNQNTSSALFLINNGADPSQATKENELPLHLAIHRHLPRVLEALCEKKVDLNIPDASGNCPLWVALESGQEDIASILVRFKCDTDNWGEGPDGCYQTLLHRAIDENNEAVGCFLIKSGCDVDSPRRVGPDGRGGEEAHDLQSPLHMACAWGLERIVQTLIEYKANVNAQDAENKTPIHVSISNQHPRIIALLLSHPQLDLKLQDKSGLTPFAVAMITKNNKAAQAILDREPRAAEQYDHKGRNFLHLAIQKSDIESILFLISINANIESRVQDSSNLSPLHLAVQMGNEMIVRNLLLAGANVNDLTPQKQMSLHLAAACDNANICSILLENGIDYNAVDSNLNNALHIAVQKGNLATVRVLLTESRINAEAINIKGQNPFHVLCQYGKENAAAIFDLFMECMPQYPINKVDSEGNTGLLLAYINGNGNLCRAIVRAGACLGTPNKHGTSIFNYQVATKRLLFRLLDYLSQEPMWAEGDSCLECGAKFGITTRKHHCRHCGRLLCAKCSEKDMPILKYNLNKPVRVCDTCFDVLTLGTPN